MSELKPCPFCGTPAELKSWVGLDFVRCIVCKAAGPQFEDHHEAAIAAWNRRAPDYAAGAEAMREAAMAVAASRTQRGCDCEQCDCMNVHNAQDVARWETETWIAAAIRALPLPEPPPDA